MHGAGGTGADVLGDSHTARCGFVAQGGVDVFQVDGLHVLAQAAGFVELLLRVLQLQAHDQSTLGQDGQMSLFRMGLDVFCHLRSGHDLVGGPLQFGLHFAMNNDDGGRILAADLRDVVDGHPMVHVARAFPSEHAADQTLPLALAQERFDAFKVFFGVKGMRVGWGQVHALGLDGDLVGEVLVGDKEDIGCT